MTYKAKTKYGCAPHLYKLGSDKTLCGKDAYSYDTEESTYTLDQFIRSFGKLAVCKRCVKRAAENEIDPSIHLLKQQ